MKDNKKNKKGLALAISKNFKKITQADALDIVDFLFNEISDEIDAGNEVNITNFGKFYIKKSSSRKIFHPETGLPIDVEEKYRVNFKPSKTLKDRITKKKVE